MVGSCYELKSLFIFKLYALLMQAVIPVFDEDEFFTWFSFASSRSSLPIAHFWKENPDLRVFFFPITIPISIFDYFEFEYCADTQVN